MNKSVEWCARTKMSAVSGCVLILLFLAGDIWAQTPIGSPVFVTGVLGDSLRKVEFSADGSRAVIGTPTNGNPGPKTPGKAAVLQWNGSQWDMMGDILTGDESDDRFGWDVAISANGMIIAVGAPFNGSSANLAGLVRVFEWSGTEWIQRGADLTGSASNLRLGSVVALSADGSRLGVSDASNAPGIFGAGSVRIYDWVDPDWVPVGSPVFGTVANDSFGYNLVLSAAGNRFAASSPLNDDASENAGKVRIFEWQDPDWTQLGDSLVGDNPGDREGQSLDMSADGDRIAIGAIGNSDVEQYSGQVRVFNWTGAGWQQLGNDLNGSGASYQFGSSTALSGDGGVLAVGSTRPGMPCFTQSGLTWVYHWSGTDWQLTNLLQGQADYDYVGADIDLDSSGTRLAVLSGPFNPTDGTTGTFTAWQPDPIGMPMAPLAQSDDYNLTQDTLLMEAAPGVLNNDNAGNPGIQCLVVQDMPDHGGLTLEQDGSFSYEPLTGFCGDDSFSYTIANGLGASETAVSLNVSCAPTSNLLFMDSFEIFQVQNQKKRSG